MRGTRAKRWGQWLLLGACLGGIQACGGGRGGTNGLDETTTEGTEQYALAVSPDGSKVASGGTFVRTTYNGEYAVDDTTSSGTTLPNDPATPTPSDPLPGPVEDIPPDNGNQSGSGDNSSGNSGGDSNSPPDESNAGEGNVDRLLRRASRGGLLSALAASHKAAGKRNLTAGRPTLTRVAVTPGGAQGQTAAASKTHRYVYEDLSGRIWYANPLNGQRVGGVNLGQIVYALAYSPDGTLLASGSQDRVLRLINSRSSAVLAELRGHGDRISGVAFAPDGKRVASAGYNDHTVRIWDVQARTQLQSIPTGSLGATAIAFSPDGATLAGAVGDGTVYIWNAQTGSVVQTLKAHKYAAFAVAYSPDGKTLASGSADNTVILWNPQTGTPQQTLTGHTNFVFGVRFSADGKLLATGSSDRTVKLWDAHTGALLNTLSAPENIQAVDFTPDSQTVIGAGGGGNLRAWDVLSGQMKWEQQLR